MAQHCYYRALLSYLGLCVLPVVNMAVLEAALVDWLSQSLALRGFCGGHEGRCAGETVRWNRGNEQRTSLGNAAV